MWAFLHMFAQTWVCTPSIKTQSSIHPWLSTVSWGLILLHVKTEHLQLQVWWHLWKSIPFKKCFLRSSKSVIKDAMPSCNTKMQPGKPWKNLELEVSSSYTKTTCNTAPPSYSVALVCDYHENNLHNISPPCHINRSLVISFLQASEHKHVAAPLLEMPYEV